MFRWIPYLVTAFLVSACVYGQVRPDEVVLMVEDLNAPHFVLFDVFVDAGDEELAAYQFELAASESYQIAGVEGGNHTAFEEPPFYDSDALAKSQIIIAAFSTDTELPKGKIRVARLHFVTPDKSITPEFTTRLTVSAAADGTKIASTISIVENQGEIQ